MWEGGERCGARTGVGAIEVPRDHGRRATAVTGSRAAGIGAVVGADRQHGVRLACLALLGVPRPSRRGAAARRQGRIRFEVLTHVGSVECGSGGSGSVVWLCGRVGVWEVWEGGESASRPRLDRDVPRNEWSRRAPTFCDDDISLAPSRWPPLAGPETAPIGFRGRGGSVLGASSKFMGRTGLRVDVLLASSSNSPSSEVVPFRVHPERGSASCGPVELVAADESEDSRDFQAVLPKYSGGGPPNSGLPSTVSYCTVAQKGPGRARKPSKGAEGSRCNPHQGWGQEKAVCPVAS